MTHAGNRTELMEAIGRKRPGRIPYTYEALPETEAILRKHLGLADASNLSDHFDCNELGHLWELVDWRHPRLPDREARNSNNPPGVTVDIWGCRTETVTVDGIVRHHTTSSPLADAQTVKVHEPGAGKTGRGGQQPACRRGAQAFFPGPGPYSRRSRQQCQHYYPQFRRIVRPLRNLENRRQWRQSQH